MRSVRDHLIESSLATALPWLVAFGLGTIAHVQVVDGLVHEHDQACSSEPDPAPHVDVDIEVELHVEPSATRVLASLAKPATYPRYTVDRCLRRPAKTSPRHGQEPWPSPELLFRVRQFDATHFQLERKALYELARADPATLASASPHIEDGRSVGLTLSDIDTCSPLGLLGLRDGDTLLRANGRALGGTSPSVMPYQRLAPATHLDLEISREGRSLHLLYELVGPTHS